MLFYTFCEAELFQKAVLTHSTLVSIQWKFRAVCIGLELFLILHIDSSLSFSHEQIFRLLLKISVYERHHLRLKPISQASTEEAALYLVLADKQRKVGNVTKPLQMNLSTNY